MEEEEEVLSGIATPPPSGIPTSPPQTACTCKIMKFEFMTLVEKWRLLPPRIMHKLCTAIICKVVDVSISL
jgi:hypothetical protein